MIQHLKFPLTFLLSVCICFTLAFSFTTPANAQTLTRQAQLEQLQMLLELLQQLQARLAEMRAVSLGDTVETTEQLTLSENLPTIKSFRKGVVLPGAIGLVVEGPVRVEEEDWWLVSYEDADGLLVYSPESSLRKVADGVEGEGRVVATITSISESENPVVKGRAYNTDVIGFSVAAPSGDKAYGSGEIEVEKNLWYHEISEDMKWNGTYELTLYDGENNELLETEFTLNESDRN